jgi:hypothetical protein
MLYDKNKLCLTICPADGKMSLDDDFQVRNCHPTEDLADERLLFYQDNSRDTVGRMPE